MNENGVRMESSLKFFALTKELNDFDIRNGYLRPEYFSFFNSVNICLDYLKGGNETPLNTIFHTCRDVHLTPRLHLPFRPQLCTLTSEHCGVTGMKNISLTV